MRKRLRIYIYVSESNYKDCQGVDIGIGGRERCRDLARYSLDGYSFCERHAKRACLWIVRQSNKRISSENTAFKMVREMDELDKNQMSG